MDLDTYQDWLINTLPCVQKENSVGKVQKKKNPKCELKFILGLLSGKAGILVKQPCVMTHGNTTTLSEVKALLSYENKRGRHSKLLISWLFILPCFC